jgi:SEC-C motif-containing protein
MKNQSNLCPCGNTKPYTACCAPYVERNEPAPTAEALMRSRYTAYTLLREDYVLATWHTSTRPASLELAADAATKWIGLDVKRHEQQDSEHAIVEFVARYKVNGRAHRLHEVSRFVREDGRWFYLDGDLD